MAIDQIDFPAPPMNLNWPPPPTPTLEELEDQLLETVQTYYENGVCSRHSLINDIYSLIQNVQHETADPETIALKQFFCDNHSDRYVELLREWFQIRLKNLNDEIQAHHFVPDRILSQIAERCSYIAFILRLLSVLFEMNAV